jgi:hypothetical protein
MNEVVMHTHDDFIIDDIHVVPYKSGTTDLYYQGYKITHLPLDIYLVVDPDENKYMLWHNDAQWFQNKKPITEPELNKLLPFFGRVREIVENRDWEE